MSDNGRRAMDRVLAAGAANALERKDTKSAAAAIAAMSPEGRAKAEKALFGGKR